MVDLSKAKAGDTVKFRCGGELIIQNIRYSNGEVPCWMLVFNVSDSAGYTEEGISLDSDLLTITKVIPAPDVFDWATVRWGDGFLQDGSRVLNFVGKHPSPRYGVFLDKQLTS